MPNLSALSNITTSATALSNLVMVSPNKVLGYQPQNPTADSDKQPPKTFLFHYEGEQNVTVESDITDHYVEDNTAREDQIGLKPETYTTRGFIGELHNVPPEYLDTVKFLADKLTPIVGFAPQLTATGQQVYNNALNLYQVGSNAANARVSTWTSISNAINDEDQQKKKKMPKIQNKQQEAFNKLYGYWASRTLFTVQTPWNIFRDMAIMRLRAIQSEETNVISDFEITFKRIRKATTNLTNLQGAFDKLKQGQLASQSAPLVNTGISAAGPESTNMGSAIAGIGGG